MLLHAGVHVVALELALVPVVGYQSALLVPRKQTRLGQLREDRCHLLAAEPQPERHVLERRQSPAHLALVSKAQHVYPVLEQLGR